VLTALEAGRDALRGGRDALREGRDALRAGRRWVEHDARSASAETTQIGDILAERADDDWEDGIGRIGMGRAGIGRTTTRPSASVGRSRTRTGSCSWRRKCCRRVQRSAPGAISTRSSCTSTPPRWIAARTAPASSSKARRCIPRPPAGSPATRAWSGSWSATGARCPSGDARGPCRPRSAGRSEAATAVAGSPAAANAASCTCITSRTGRTAGEPTWPTWCSCARTTIAWSTRAATGSNANPLTLCASAARTAGHSSPRPRPQPASATSCSDATGCAA